jgi:uncharacterized metal-binding protein YceD (DUF177 family)
MKQPQMPQIEFSRPLKVDRVPRDGSLEEIAAAPPECAALAKRLGVPAVHAVSARLRANPWRGGGLKIEGKLVADLDQLSVVSLEAFRHTVEFPVLRYFLPPGAAVDAGEDVDAIEAGHVDLGEVVSETLALELDPYPRKPGEAFAEPVEALEEGETEPSPFAALARLKRP